MIWDRFRTWRQSGRCHLTVASNSSDKLSAKLQYGGTSIITFNKVTNTYLDSGVDTTKLGRWVWARFRGDEG